MANPKLATMSQIARVLDVSLNQVWAWHSRRKANGFPEAVASVIARKGAGGPHRAPLFILREVLQWHEDYLPYARNGKHWAEKRAAAKGA